MPRRQRQPTTPKRSFARLYFHAWFLIRPGFSASEFPPFAYASRHEAPQNPALAACGDYLPAPPGFLELAGLSPLGLRFSTGGTRVPRSLFNSGRGNDGGFRQIRLAQET